jgi:hypothetical protein
LRSDFKDWSDGWIKPGYYISFVLGNTYHFEHVLMRDLAHIEYDWYEEIAALSESGPKVPEFLEVTKEYDPDTCENRVWQVIFGIYGQAYVYVELPTDIHRHGIPKIPKPSSDFRRVSHFVEWMSPFDEPTFLTEHFMMRPTYDRINFSAYNPNDEVIRSLKLNFFINRMITERIGTVTNGTQKATKDRWTETLDKLYRHLIPCTPITLEPVRAPAEAHH